MFEGLTTRLGSVFAVLRGKGRLSVADVDAALREVRLALLEADVNVSVARALLDRVRARAVGAEVTKSLTPGQQVVKIVHEELVTTLGGESVALAHASKAPLIVLLAGLQGSGKTTTAAKLARRLAGQGKHPMLVAADLQRPAAIDQLETLGRRIGVPVFIDRGGKPAKLVKAALKRAAEAGHDVVIIDTAGRMQIDEPLMAELAEVRRVADPHEVLLVLDAMTGQDAVNVASGFLERADLTGLILSKLDGDARGGAAISAREVTGRPIKFAGTGEGLDDLEVFHPERMASRILGMGDVLTLIEKAEQTWDADEAAVAADKMRTASFTLEDFLDQFQQVRRMGSMRQLLGMLPGAASALGKVDVSDKDLGRVEAIIRSMTPTERQDPKTIDGSRKRRIAAGSGTSAQDVNGLLRKFAETQKLMRAFAEGKNPIPGLGQGPVMPRRGRNRKR
ncbi:MAG: signal recognition particle protein [Actinomycetota bacterium]